MKPAALALLVLSGALLPCTSWASPPQATLIDQVAVRFEASELGGPEHPRFIFTHILAFEARLEAMEEPARTAAASPSAPFEERHVRAALERHVTEEILESLPVEPPITNDELRRRVIATWITLEQQVSGRQNLLDAAFAEGLEIEDLNLIVERRARASLYLDRMVTPMLNPSEAELREVHRTEPTPYRTMPFEKASPLLRRWYVTHRLSSALAAFFRSARARIRIVVLRA